MVELLRLQTGTDFSQNIVFVVEQNGTSRWECSFILKFSQRLLNGTRRNFGLDAEVVSICAV